MPRERLVIRRATLRDRPTLVRHRRGMFIDMGRDDPRLMDRADVDYAAWMRRMVKARRFIAFLAVSSRDGVVASGAVWLVEKQPRPGFAGGWSPYLMSMYTEPSHRGRGLASRIVTTATRWCKDHGGFRMMSLHASPMGRRVYRRLGWTRTHEYVLPLR